MTTIKKQMRGGCEDVIYEGRINSSQDGIVINARGIALTHTAGHGRSAFGRLLPKGRKNSKDID